MTNIKPFFWESEANLETVQKVSPYIWASYKFVLKSVNSLYWIFRATEYWLKALKCKIWLRNTKSFFSKSEANIETLENFSAYISVSYKSKSPVSVKRLNRIFLATEYLLKALKSQIWLTNTKPFFWESETSVETLQKLSPYIWVSYKFVLRSVSKLNGIFSAKEYLFKALKCQIWLTYTKPTFFVKRGKHWHSPKHFSLYLSFLLICFEVCQKSKSILMSYEILVQDFKMNTLVDEYKTIFLWEKGKPWNSPKRFFLYLSFL